MKLAIVFEYLWALLLVPIMGFALWSLLDGDRMRADDEDTETTAVRERSHPAAEPQPTPTTEAATETSHTSTHNARDIDAPARGGERIRAS